MATTDAAEVSSEFSVVTVTGTAEVGFILDPFLAVNLGEEMQHQYRSDATQRLNNPELWTVTAMRKIRQLSSVAEWEVRVQLDDLCYNYQQVSVRKVQSLRSNITAMAQTLVELLAQPSYDQQTKQECEDELQDRTLRAHPTVRLVSW